MRILIPAVAALALVACNKPAPAPVDTTTTTTTTANDNSMGTVPAATTTAGATAAAGKYRGTMPTADGAGSESTLVLNADGSYELTRVGADKKAAKVTGKYTMNPDGKTVVLDAAGSGAQVMLAEGGVHVLDATGKPYTGADATKYVLRKQ